MMTWQRSKAPANSADETVFELRGVPADKVAEVVDDFLSEGPSAVDKELEKDGTFTIRIRRLVGQGSSKLGIG